MELKTSALTAPEKTTDATLTSRGRAAPGRRLFFSGTRNVRGRAPAEQIPEATWGQGRGGRSETGRVEHQNQVLTRRLKISLSSSSALEPDLDFLAVTAVLTGAGVLSATTAARVSGWRRGGGQTVERYDTPQRHILRFFSGLFPSCSFSLFSSSVLRSLPGHAHTRTSKVLRPKTRPLRDNGGGGAKEGEG